MIAQVAFVVPAFNARDTLADTLAAIVAQTSPDWQATIVDDGSTDDTAGIVRHLSDPRLALVRQQNSGLAAARNTGLRETRAEFVTFLDADDIVAPDFAATMTRAIADADLAVCATRMLGPHLEDLDWVIRLSPADCTPQRMLDFNPCAVGSILCRTAFLRRLGISDRAPLFNPSLPCHEDWDAWLRLTSGGARWAPPVPDPLFGYRLRAGSMSTHVQRMHDVGLAVIANAIASDAEKHAAAHRWTLRHLARAVVADDIVLSSAFLTRLPAPTEADLAVFRGALKHNLAMAAAISPPALSPIAIHDLLTRHLRGWVADPAALGLAPDAEATPAAILHELEPGDIPVIYGMGRNGQTLLSRLSTALGNRQWAWIDDNTLASAPGARLTVDDLTDRHLVIVTPEHAAPIERTLSAKGIRCRTLASFTASTERRKPAAPAETLSAR